jgi:hypothetical protein
MQRNKQLRAATMAAIGQAGPSDPMKRTTQTAVVGVTVAWKTGHASWSTLGIATPFGRRQCVAMPMLSADPARGGVAVRGVEPVGPRARGR